MGIFGTITVKGFSASGYKKLKVEFEAAVPEASKKNVENSIKILRNKATFTGTPKWAAGNTAVEFESASALPEGEYTLTVNGEEKGKATVVAEYVKDIIIDQDKKVLTGTSSASKLQGRSNDEAYIYYDVVNQYDESIRHRVTINWSVTSCDTNKERSNRSLGLIVAQMKNDRDIFTYGSTLHVTGTCITGSQKKSKEFVLTIGQQQAVDKVEILGTVDKRTVKDAVISMDDVKKDAIDEDFTKNTHALLYQVKDQNGNYIEASRNNLGSATENAKFVLRSKNPGLVEDRFADGGIFTVNDKNDPEKEKYSEYCSANIEPGRYVDKGGEAEFDYITTGTAGQDSKKLTIKERARLASFKIETPSFIVADGDENVVLNYTAIDTDGNSVTDYRTIARSSNYLNFTASDGTLVLREKDNGEAELLWTDAGRYRYTIGTNGEKIEDTRTNKFNPYDKNHNNNIVINDGIDRAVSLTATIDGTPASTTILSVADMRRPELVSDVRYGENDTVIAQDTEQEVNVIWDMEYTDQYGVPFDKAIRAENGAMSRKEAFWTAAINKSIPGCEYAIRIQNLSGEKIVENPWSPTGSTDATDDNYYDYSSYTISHSRGNKSRTKVADAAVSYSVIRRDATSSATISGSYDRWQWYELGKSRTENYTIVPLNMVSDFNIETNANKLGIVTDLSQYANGSYNYGSGASGSFNYGGHDPNAAVTGEAVGINIPQRDRFGNYIHDKDGNNIYDVKTDNNSNSPYIVTNRIHENENIWLDISSDYLNYVRVISKYKGNILTVPNCYYSVTEEGPWGQINKDGVRKVASGSGILLDKYEDKIERIASGALKWSDLYNLNDARYVRKDAELKLQLFVSNETEYDKVAGKWDLKDGYYWYYDNAADIGDNTKKHITKNDKDIPSYDSSNFGKLWGYVEGTLIERKIKISDELAGIQRISIPDTKVINPDDTGIVNANLVGSAFGVDQYGQKVDFTEGELSKHKFIYTISNYKENTNTAAPNNDIRYNGNYDIINNASENSSITGVERGDTYDVTVELSNSGLAPKTVKVTAGADTKARIVSNIGILNSPEYELRYNHLGYNR